MTKKFRFPQIYGILNATPDSFSDGGRFNTSKTALEHAKKLIDDGADYIDLGAESTRPGHVAVVDDEEIRRIKDVLPLLRREGFPISLDTSKSKVARFGLEHGVEVINDVRGLHGDPEIASVAAEFTTSLFKPKVIIMHWDFGQPEASHLELNKIKDYFDHSIETALKRGLSKEQLILDIGAGFAKMKSASLEAVRLIPQLKDHYDLLIMAGLSRKRFLSPARSSAIEDRLIPGLAADMFAVLNGADMVRVHDVRATKMMFDMWQALAQ